MSIRSTLFPETRAHAFLAALSLSALCACGGGGGSGSSSTGPFDGGAGFNNTVLAITFADDSGGDLYVGGIFTDYDGNPARQVARLNADGSFDSKFNTGIGFNSSIADIAPATDGSRDIWVGGGFTDYNGTTVPRIVRLNSNGTIDSAFSTGAGFDGSIETILPAADGSGDVYVGGTFTTYQGESQNRIARLNADGTLDSSFDVGTGLDGRVSDIQFAPDGSGDLYVSGSFTTYQGVNRPRITRINPDGSNDASFATGTGFDASVERLAVARDNSGDIYAIGMFTIFRGNARQNIARVNSDGSNDGDFTPGTGFNGNPQDIALVGDGSGDFYISGDFTAYDGQAAPSLIRIDAMGTAVNSFDVGSGPNTSFVFLAPTEDQSGNLYIAGTFVSFNGAPVSRGILRLDPLGQPN
ncbi:MAG: hypothetical protein AB8G23_05625 [Myxococcota bacterium]